MPPESIMIPPGAIDRLTNNPEPGLGSLPLCCWSEGSKRPQTNMGLLPLYFVASLRT